MKGIKLSFGLAAVVAALSSTAFAYTVEGTVSDEGGQAVSGASVSLLKEGKSAKTDASGKFSIHEDEAAVVDPNQPGTDPSQPGTDPSQPGVVPGTEAIKGVYAPGFVSINNGILSYSQSSTAPVQVKIFDMMGNQVMNKTLQGAGTLDLRNGIKNQGVYIAKVRVGNAAQAVRFTTNGHYSSTLQASGNALMKAVTPGETLTVVADGFDTLSIPLGTLDTTVALKLTKSAPKEKTYKFGYALGNNPTPSKGCGKDATLKGTENWQCDRSEGGDCNQDAQLFSIQVGNDKRTYYMTFPKDYDKNKPYKLLIANHCMGSSANHMATWINVNQDHPSPYYGQLNLDTEHNYIFVAPQGDGSGMWTKGEADHQFISDMLTKINDNYCIDTSRVFATGFSFGAMFSNSLAQSFQHRLRAVAVYAVADYNIYLPDNAGKPIAWMGVHGTQDGMCDYNRAKNSAVKRILKNNGKASDGDSQFTDASSEEVPNYSGRGHDCYDFKNVDERFPVKFCSWGGPHQWTANDDGNWRNSWVPKMVKEFFEQF